VMGKKKLVVIYPYRFRDFDWQRFELDFLAPHVEIHVHELIDALTPEFGAAYANQSENPAVKRFVSLKDWRKEFKKIYEDAIIFNHVRPINLKSTLICATLRRSGVSVVGFSTGGVPIVDLRIDPTRRDLPKLLKNALHFFRRNLLLIFMPNKVVVGGTEQVNRVRRDFPRVTKRVLANSSDFSNSIGLKEIVASSESKAVYLDIGFPGFPSDFLLEKVLSNVNSDNWYPALSNFFELVERFLGITVEISAHPKHYGRDHTRFFGSRIVLCGNSVLEVRNSELVISTVSTSVSYAVSFHKPLILVTSDEIINDKNAYLNESIKIMAVETGARIFNIDREYTEQDLREAMVIDHAKYESYKRKYLTSRTDGKPNYQVLLDEVIFSED
jgi:hypothetical protein